MHCHPLLDHKEKSVALAPKLTLRVEHRDTLIILTNVEQVVGVYGNTPRPFQFPPALTMTTKHPQEPPLGCEDLDTMIPTVSHTLSQHCHTPHPTYN